MGPDVGIAPCLQMPRTAESTATFAQRWGIQLSEGTAPVLSLWERWRLPAGNEVVSFTMLTINCDAHPPLNRFHKRFDEGRAQ